MSDLVKRLKEQTAAFSPHDRLTVDCLMREAADEIQRLTNNIEALELVMADLRDEAVVHEKAFAELLAKALECAAENERLAKRCEELRALNRLPHPDGMVECALCGGLWHQNDAEEHLAKRGFDVCLAAPDRKDPSDGC